MAAPLMAEAVPLLGPTVVIGVYNVMLSCSHRRHHPTCVDASSLASRSVVPITLKAIARPPPSCPRDIIPCNDGG